MAAGSDRTWLLEWLETFCESMSPKEFYREIFPCGELARHDENGVPGKYCGVAVEIDNDSDRIQRCLLTDELDQLDALLESESFVILSPISYAGKSRRSENARYFYALAMDLDGIKELHQVVDLFHHAEKIQIIPRPTYTVWSGSGLHLYWRLERPIPCYKNIMKQLAILKNELTRRVWNRYVTSEYERPQIQSVFQGFRLVGGVTKGGNRTVAFRTGPAVTIEYLNSFVEEKYRAKEIVYKGAVSLTEAREKYPEWYNKRIVEGRPKGSWTANRAVYDWWLKKIRTGASVGHRYYCLMCLAVYAKKCGIDREELERDVFGLVEVFDVLTVDEGNHFTRGDAYVALEMYNDNYVTFPIESIEKLSAIKIERNKRNGRTQAMHLARARAVQQIDYPNGEWRDGNGRPSKEEIVREWQRQHPQGRKVDCIRDTGLSKQTVYKWWMVQKIDERFQ